MQEKKVLAGFGIVVADRGFVYVGSLEITPEWCVVTNAQNVRVWGTTKGLGELALKGPTKTTKLDAVGTVRIPARAVISVMDSEEKLWTKS